MKKIIKLDSFSELEKRQMNTISEYQEQVKQLKFDIIQLTHDIKEKEEKNNKLKNEIENFVEKYKSLELQLKSSNYKISNALEYIKKQKESVGMVPYIFLHELEDIFEKKR